ncbi:MAG: cell division protein ZipA [Halieaceae bacterium]|jgi:cell division protein ZipA|nr:cell division protein ZipA [Halieaceae bacterium]
MDISVRDWMIIIGVLLIVAVLLDGYRRMRDPNRIRVSLTDVPDSGDDDVSVSRELPNGGARVKPRSAAEQAADAAEEASVSAAGSREPDPPLLTEPAGRSSRRAGVKPEPAPDSGPEADSSEDANDPLFAKAPVMRAQRGENLDLLAGIEAAGDDHGGSGGEPQEVLMLHVVSRDERGFPGDDILQVLLAYNLRFGEMDFFHRHDEAAGRGKVQFSVANMLKPGVFDIDHMSDFSTTGLIFFMTLPGPRDMMGAFELMLETARGVAEHLGGDVLDESRSVATRQTLEHMRQRIRDLERKLLARAGR